MKKFFTLLIVSTFFGLMANAVVWPTKVIKVEPDQGTSIGALQAAITANGSAIYELKRGGIYLTNGQYTIPAAAGTLILRAEAGTGPRPVIMGGVPTSGYPAGDNVIRINADIKFENIYLTGEDMNGVIHKNTLRIQAGTWFEFNGCMFDKDAAASIRNGVGNCTYIFYNCTFRNQIDYASLSNGRAWDAREAFKNITLIMKNCTFYNMSSRIIRPSTSDFDSIVFVNNTCYNIWEALNLGFARKARVNNNIFYNCGLSGGASATSAIIDLDSIGTSVDATRTFDFRNNLFYTDKAYLDVMVSPVDTFRYLRGLLNEDARAFLKNKQAIMTDSIKNQSITFNNPPPFIIGFVKNMWLIKWKSGFTPTQDQMMEAVEDQINFGDVLPPKVPYNFGYATTSPAYTAGLNGTIMGDKKYFGPLTGINSIKLPGFDVNAYFNSGTKTLNIVLGDSEMEKFSLRVFGIDGRQIARRQLSVTGEPIIRTNLYELNNNGIYIFEIDGISTDGNRKRATGKFVL